MTDFQAYANHFGALGEAVPQASWATGAAASFASAWEAGAPSSVARFYELEQAGLHAFDPQMENLPADDPFRLEQEAGRQRFKRISNADAKARIKEAGFKFDIGEGDLSEEAPGLLIERAKTRQLRGQQIASSEISLPAQLGIGFAAGIADPVNVAAAFIPIVGPARYAAMLEGAATTAARIGVRARVGAIEGAAGAALLEPFTAAAATQEGQDYGVTNALLAIGGGIVLGATLHNVAGGAADVWRSRFSNDPPDAGNLGSRLTPEMQQAALVKAADDLIQGNPVDVGSTIHRLAKEDPKLAERVLVGAALRRDGPDIADLPARQEWWVARLKQAALERRRKGKTDEAAYTERLKQEAGIKPRTTHAVAARRIVDYERSVMQAERTRALDAERGPEVSELIGDEALTPEMRAELDAERAAIDEMLGRETSEIDIYTACLMGEET